MLHHEVTLWATITIIVRVDQVMHFVVVKPTLQRKADWLDKYTFYNSASGPDFLLMT